MQLLEEEFNCRMFERDLAISEGIMTRQKSPTESCRHGKPHRV